MWNVKVNGHFPTCKDDYFLGMIQHGSDISITYAALPNYAALEDSEEGGHLLQAWPEDYINDCAIQIVTCSSKFNSVMFSKTNLRF